jgi:hypothetical protein
MRHTKRQGGEGMSIKPEAKACPECGCTYLYANTDGMIFYTNGIEDCEGIPHEQWFSYTCSNGECGHTWEAK